MAIDLNDAGSQRDFGATIPDGTFAIVRMAFRPGGASLPGMPSQDAGLFKIAKPPSDAVMLDTTFTVLFGPHAKRQIFQNYTVEGGKRDEKGNSIAWGITKRFLRAAVESALGVNPKDETPAAKAKRNVPSISALNGLEFSVRIGIESDSTGRYPDKNQIAHVVTPDEPEWSVLKQGQIPDPRPRIGGAGHRTTQAAPAVQEPAWKAAAAPAQASPAPVWQQQVPGAAAAPIAQPAQQTWPTTPQPQPQPEAPVKPGPAWLNS